MYRAKFTHLRRNGLTSQLPQVLATTALVASRCPSQAGSTTNSGASQVIRQADRVERGLQHPPLWSLDVFCRIRLGESRIPELQPRSKPATRSIPWTDRNLLSKNHRGDGSDIEKGYLRSLLLTWKHTFTSPSSANDVEVRDDITRDENAPLAARQCVTSRSIAYAAVRLLLALSSLDIVRAIKVSTSVTRIATSLTSSMLKGPHHPPLCLSSWDGEIGILWHFKIEAEA
ncbi:hypothetical protein BKA70DRAFT_1562492 [Coprinopsis sp. MPI-PUGE-AT-0042]|nr:hypothetical protein BKA70DRAFT_1562492 [Coprinopsis sp. MPI-PUGE-AT-0042]